MSERHDDALYAQVGACNPSGLCISLVEHYREVRAEGGNVRTDSACRLIVHQLSFLMGCELIAPSWYDAAMKECAQKARPEVVESCRMQDYLK